jgi:hypothetical protein
LATYELVKTQAAQQWWTICALPYPAGTTTCVLDRTCGASWYQPRMAWNSGVETAAGLSSS